MPRGVRRRTPTESSGMIPCGIGQAQALVFSVYGDASIDLFYNLEHLINPFRLTHVLDRF